MVDTGHPLLPKVIPGLSASVFIHAIIRHMIQEISDTPPVMLAPVLPDWTPVTLLVHSSPNPQGHDAVGTCTRPFPQEEAGLNPPASPTGHTDESDSDCQIQEGPEPDTSSVMMREIGTKSSSPSL